jgi:hypothetical protein
MSINECSESLNNTVAISFHSKRRAEVKPKEREVRLVLIYLDV